MFIYLVALGHSVACEVKVLVAQLCSTLCTPTDCNPPGSFVHGTLQARILEWIAIPFSRWSSLEKDETPVSCIGTRFFPVWATRETLVVACGNLMPWLGIEPPALGMWSFSHWTTREVTRSNALIDSMNTHAGNKQIFCTTIWSTVTIASSNWVLSARWDLREFKLIKIMAFDIKVDRERVSGSEATNLRTRRSLLKKITYKMDNFY